MAMSVEHRSKFAALHRQWWRLHMSEIIEWDEKTNKATKFINFMTNGAGVLE